MTEFILPQTTSRGKRKERKKAKIQKNEKNGKYPTQYPIDSEAVIDTCRQIVRTQITHYK